ncbi:MAG: hypothetical protein EXR86_16655 [Gammaproteobacteria bacterium]|nr:hypothetical protein [Gammaproteobacteria bacterium]
MNDGDKQDFPLEIERLNGVVEEIQDKLLAMEQKLNHTSYRLFKMAVMTGAAFVILLALTGAIFLSNVF